MKRKKRKETKLYISTDDIENLHERYAPIIDETVKSILRKAGNVDDLSYSSNEYKTWWSNISSAILNGRTPEEMNEDSYTIFDNIKVITHRVYNGVDYGDITLYDGECIGQGWEVFEVSATSLAYSSSAIIAG